MELVPAAAVHRSYSLLKMYTKSKRAGTYAVYCAVHVAQSQGKSHLASELEHDTRSV